MNQVSGTTNNIFVEIRLFKAFVKARTFLLHFLQVVENLCVIGYYIHRLRVSMKLRNNVAYLLCDHIPECPVLLEKSTRPYFHERL